MNKIKLCYNFIPELGNQCICVMSSEDLHTSSWVKDNGKWYKTITGRTWEEVESQVQKEVSRIVESEKLQDQKPKDRVISFTIK